MELYQWVPLTRIMFSFVPQGQHFASMVWVSAKFRASLAVLMPALPQGRLPQTAVYCWVGCWQIYLLFVRSENSSRWVLWGEGRDGSLVVFSSTIQNVKSLCGASRTGSNVGRRSRDGSEREMNYPSLHKTAFGNLLIFVLPVPFSLAKLRLRSSGIASLWKSGTAVHIWT